MAEHNNLGLKGERIAQEQLLKKGFVIKERNWRFKKAEVDIIAENEDFIIAVEVKTRSTADFGNPQDFVSKKKIKLLVEAMNEYVISNNIDKEVRFDIIALTKEKDSFKIEHLEDAFLHF